MTNLQKTKILNYQLKEYRPAFKEVPVFFMELKGITLFIREPPPPHGSTVTKIISPPLPPTPVSLEHILTLYSCLCTGLQNGHQISLSSRSEALISVSKHITSVVRSSGFQVCSACVEKLCIAVLMCVLHPPPLLCVCYFSFFVPFQDDFMQ
jgi:hypothetical protein